MTLDSARLRDPLVVTRIRDSAHAPDWAQRLEELGFIPGEPVMLMAAGPFGGDPLVVRVGASTFALRRAEAACIEVDRPPCE
jgi:ferrous iron transport protein A